MGQAGAAITTNLLKLKNLWDELRDVPDDLVHLVQELEIVNSVLAESQEQGPSGSSRSLELAMKLTSDGARELGLLVDESQSQVRQNKNWKGKLMAVKVVLRKDQVKKLKSRLKSCLRLLELTKQCQLK